MSSIFLIGQDNALTELRQTSYASEDQLQRLLADYPAVLGITGQSDDRLLLICRELGVPQEQGGGDRLSLDHLFVDQRGVPVLVEVKRAADTRSRREVVAQMLDYAANGVAYWPIDHLRRGTDRLMTWLREVGCQVGTISGQKSISARVATPDGRQQLILNVDRSGKVWLSLGGLKYSPAFKDETAVLEILKRLRSLVGIHLSSATQYPTFPAQDLARDEPWSEFQKVIGDIIARLRTGQQT